MIKADFHMHSAHSEDSDTPMEQQIEAAVEAGLKYICFTEHMDKDWPEDDGVKKGGAPVGKALFLLDTETYYKHCMECRDAYKDRIDIRFGDIVAVIGGIPMYIEMIRLQITVFLRIRKQDNEDKAE